MTRPEYIPQYLPIRLKHQKLIDRRLKRDARGTREFPPTPPTLPCKRCEGKGCYVKSPDGERRPFDHRNFKPGDRYYATCSKCRGGGRRPCTVDELRQGYRKIRKLVCDERGFDSRFFDRMVKKQAGKDPSAMMWYEAAKHVASSYGVETAGL